MCNTCELSGRKKVVSITEDNGNAIEVRPLKNPGGFSQRSKDSKMSKRSPIHLVYCRRKHKGASAAISEEALTKTYQGIVPHNHAKSKEICRASQDHHKAGDFGQYSAHKVQNLVYCRRKFQGISAPLPEEAQRQTYPGVDPHNHAKSKEICRASKEHHEAGDSAQYSAHTIHNLVYCRRKVKGTSPTLSENVQRQAYQVVDYHKNGKSKEICRASQDYHKAENSGQCSAHKIHSLVYRRRKILGRSAAISDQAQRQTYQGMDSHKPAKSKEICRASQVQNEAGDSGQYSMHKIHNLVYSRRKVQGISASVSELARRKIYQGLDPHSPAKSKDMCTASLVDHEAGVDHISEQAQMQSYQGVVPHNPAKSKEICRASQVHHKAGDYGQCSVQKSHILVYCRRKFLGVSAARSEQAPRQEGVDPHKTSKSMNVRRDSLVDHEAGDSRQCLVHTIHDFCEASINVNQSKKLDGVNSCSSSSKLNLDLMKTGIVESGECSSFCAGVMEEREIKISAKKLCISVLKSAGLLGVRPKRSRNPVENGVKSCSQLCKICRKSEATSKMLICDNCEEAFHVTCCSSRGKRIPNEWFCSSCLKLKRNVLKETRGLKTLHLSRERDRCHSLSHKDELDHITMLLEDNGKYRSSIRVGKSFQADIPDWIGLANYKVDVIDKPMEIDSSEYLNFQKLNSTKNSRFSSIGNWLQCREIIDGVGGASGTVCGKWRRAPLSEVQTDNWECFCSVLWDPAYADCNVPQELETDQVLKQLKHVEMLRPRLAAKRRKLDCTTTDNI